MSGSFTYQSGLVNTITYIRDNYIKFPETAPVFFTLQPESQTAETGQQVTFISAANGSPTPTYQWQLDSGGGFGDISGATSASYTTPTLDATDDQNDYRCVATNSEGSVNSDTVTLSINLALVSEQITFNTIATTGADSVSLDPAIWGDQVPKFIIVTAAYTGSDGVVDNAAESFGFATAAAQSSSSAFMTDNPGGGAGSTACRTYYSETKVCVNITWNGAITFSGTLVSLTNTAINFNWNVCTSSRVVNVLAVGGTDVTGEIVFITAPGSTGNQYINLGYKPDALIQHTSKVAAAGGSDHAHIDYGFWADGVNRQSCLYSHGNSAASQADSGVQDTFTGGLAFNTSVRNKSTVSYTDATGFNLNWSLLQDASFKSAVLTVTGIFAKVLTSTQPVANGTVSIPTGIADPKLGLHISAMKTSLVANSANQINSPHGKQSVGMWSAQSDSQSSIGVADQDAADPAVTCSSQLSTAVAQYVDGDQTVTGTAIASANGSSIDEAWTNCDGTQRLGYWLAMGSGYTEPAAGDPWTGDVEIYHWNSSTAAAMTDVEGMIWAQLNYGFLPKPGGKGFWDARPIPEVIQDVIYSGVGTGRRGVFLYGWGATNDDAMFTPLIDTITNTGMTAATLAFMQEFVAGLNNYGWTPDIQILDNESGVSFWQIGDQRSAIESVINDAGALAQLPAYFQGKTIDDLWPLPGSYSTELVNEWNAMDGELRIVAFNTAIFDPTDTEFGATIDGAEYQLYQRDFAVPDLNGWYAQPTTSQCGTYGSPVLYPRTGGNRYTGTDQADMELNWVDLANQITSAMIATPNNAPWIGRPDYLRPAGITEADWRNNWGALIYYCRQAGVDKFLLWGDDWGAAETTFADSVFAMIRTVTPSLSLVELDTGDAAAIHDDWVAQFLTAMP